MDPEAPGPAPEAVQDWTAWLRNCSPTIHPAPPLSAVDGLIPGTEPVATAAVAPASTSPHSWSKKVRRWGWAMTMSWDEEDEPLSVRGFEVVRGMDAPIGRDAEPAPGLLFMAVLSIVMRANIGPTPRPPHPLPEPLSEPDPPPPALPANAVSSVMSRRFLSASRASCS